MKNSRISLAFKALRELGFRQLGLFALYQVELKIGYFKWKTRDEGIGGKLSSLHPILDLPDPDAILKIIGLEGLSQLKVEADEIVEGRVWLFGGSPVALNLVPPGELSHWMDYALGKSPFPKFQSANSPIPDIKFIWEPARFGWAFTLGRAYHLTADERYSEAFWRYFEIFQQANPPNMGPNWESAQEVAFRILAFVFAAQIFENSSHTTALRTSHLARSIAEHAARIPPSLMYARAQNNNHLLSEAAGLVTAALALPEHPDARRWSKLGWKWFNRGLESQIAEDGSYMQHSTNYHRLMLQLALWVFQLQHKQSAIGQISKHAVNNLQIATQWLLNLLDRESGHVPNLGPNDGAYILPLTNLPFADYRPVLQATARAFSGKPALRPGLWDEMAAWLFPDVEDQVSQLPEKDRTPSTLHGSHSWAYLRAAKFHDRPGHADQLHLDLWWHGLNVAQDAGSYLYNADPPWDNALTHTAVHNTVMIDGLQQMTPAGRFLYLDRAQAEVLNHEQAEDGSWERIVASHDGYQCAGMIHTRSVTACQDDRWMVEDRIQPLLNDVQQATHVVRLQWLLPNWPFELVDSEGGIQIKSPYGWVSLAVRSQRSAINYQLVRAGELLYGTGDIAPTWGWVSPTYGVREPALSFVVAVADELPITLFSEWIFPEFG